MTWGRRAAPTSWPPGPTPAWRTTWRGPARGAEKTSAYNLILIGAFDALGPRPETLRRLERYRATDKLAESTLTRPERLEKIVGQRLASGKYEIPVPDFDDPAVVYEIEKRLVGTYVTVDPMARYVGTLDAAAIRDPLDMVSIPFGDRFIVGGQLTEIRPLVTKKGRNPGREMAHHHHQLERGRLQGGVLPRGLGGLQGDAHH